MITRPLPNAFDLVKDVGLTLPRVELSTKYDGSPVLKLCGLFMADLAMHPSAEPETLVIRYGLEERANLIADAPGAFYITSYYQRYALMLVRLKCIERDALHELLSISWRMTMAKVPKRAGKAINGYLPNWRSI